MIVLAEVQDAKSKRSIPVICVCFGGGPGTIKVLAGAVHSGRPIILVQGSMRVTDCIVQLVALKHKLKKEEDVSKAKHTHTRMHTGLCFLNHGAQLRSSCSRAPSSSL